MATLGPTLPPGCLLLDLETTRQGRIRALGAVLDGARFARGDRGDLAGALRELDEFAAPAALVVGHNLVDHDLAALRRAAPELALLHKPALDTLHLSPLAFPRHPYHPLIKSYQDFPLRRQGAADPLLDALLAGEALSLELGELRRRAAVEPLLVALYAGLLVGEGSVGQGFARLFAALAIRPLEPPALPSAIRELVADRACGAAARELGERLLAARLDRPALAYAIAFVTIAGEDSILPVWVRRRHPAAWDYVRALRGRICADRDCAYCRQQGDAGQWLNRCFGHSRFRPHPAAADGSSLQGAIVQAGLEEQPLLALMPTGAGKSLAFQLPALVHYQRTGALTIVLSPLQALMQDQVASFARATGSTLAAALHGALTPLERAEVLEQIRGGRCGLLYVAPEQLRNRSFRRAIENRAIAAWVVDEAHCLAQWGHDLRPDYLYLARFVRGLAEKQAVPPPPVACFTATARPEVEREILDYFAKWLHQQLQVFRSPAGRDNLVLTVEEIRPQEKLPRIAERIEEALSAGPGAAIVYRATRRRCEETAAFLVERGLAAAPFHAGLAAPLRRDRLADFLGGRLRIVCATSAFGMGVDKPDVRLVVHGDVPGSLEAYLQEAGRAGRDGEPARGILLYHPDDLEVQFQLLARGRLTRRDLATLLRGLRRARPIHQEQVALSARELLRCAGEELSFSRGATDGETRIRAAVSWLERLGFVERDENETQVFQGRPRVESRAEAAAHLARLRQPPPAIVATRWLALLDRLFAAAPDELLGVDDLLDDPAVRRTFDGVAAEDQPGLLLEGLAALVLAGLLDGGLRCTAFLRHGVVSPSRERLAAVATVEQALLARLREEAPDDDDRTWRELNLRALNERLREHGADVELLRDLLRSLGEDGRDHARRRGAIVLRYVARDRYWARLEGSWEALLEAARRRREVAGAVLATLLDRLPPGQGPSAEAQVEFTLADLVTAVTGDLFHSQVASPLREVERALTFLHEQRVIQLHQGLAVFRQAMTLRRLPQAQGRRLVAADLDPLEQHQEGRRLGVHVMDEYARLALAAPARAERFARDYFSLEREPFLRRHFLGRRELLRRATSAASYRAIVEQLESPAQQAVVEARLDESRLVLAGPGAGKTRTLVHRLAYLLRVERVAPEAILAVAFNRGAALEIRRRLRALVGADGDGVMVATYHGLALRLTGRSLAVTGEALHAAKEGYFDDLLDEAVALVEGRKGAANLEPDELRDRLLAGYSHLLVDEYQDIDQRQYDLLSAIAGRGQGEEGRRLALLAVGDDDQNIYSFRETNVAFIRRFEEDYGAARAYLVENYRSSAPIVAAANRLIAHGRGRLKEAQPIVVDHHRAGTPGANPWAEKDPRGGGQVQLLTVADRAAQAHTIVAELLRLRGLDPGLDLGRCAVLARHRADLDPIRAACEAAGLPIRRLLPRDKMPPLFRIRELALHLDALQDRRGQRATPAALRALLGDGQDPWRELLRQGYDAVEAEQGEGPLAVERVREALIELLVDTRRSQALGRGLLLGTIHSAKGLEFDHVLLPDGGSLDDGRKGSLEEERRVLYVAMTRARQTLTLCRRGDARNLLLDDLRGDGLLERPGLPAPRRHPARRYHLFDLSELYLDFASRAEAQSPLHRHLARLRPGDGLRLKVNDVHVAFVDEEGHELARLAQRVAGHWREQAPRVERLEVVAMIRRTVDEVSEEYRSRCQVERWEVPIVEATLRG